MLPLDMVVIPNHFVYFQHGEIWLEVVFVAPDEDSDDENHEYEDENGFR